MKAQIIFRSLLIAQVIFGLSMVPVVQAHFSDLTTLLAWNSSSSKEIAITIGIISMVIAILTFIAGLIGSFFYIKWGRIMLIVSAIIFLISNNIVRIWAGLPIHSMLHETMAAALYIALTMSFLSPISHRFEAK